ncbi:phytoene desaturase family protein [Natronogracilivirga saccharolytica]|uniref:Phytoene desaturase n=1 Tax=Natronogracilivirga saccharolytica TaxID=2812953 RepID=A0A8J7RU99_9BACT|nr:phytoene desaturase family protein [Natronogracilivirga saccharolytica]MBP3193077.1 phytoene desaturase [Natronogracilivirga saccharolytica]
MKISIIGAGLGGLASAAILAARGHAVDLFEKNDHPGGKMQEVRINGFRFDTGPSLLTMPFVIERIFELCGKKTEDYLDWVPVEPVCRYQFSDGVVFNNYYDAGKNRNELLRVAPEDVEAWDEFMDYSADLYRHTSETFLFNPLQRPGDFNLTDLPDFLKIDAFSTVAKRVDDYFSSPRLRQLFKRFTTYNGSSPYLAPATLNVIPFVELRLGGFYIKGGMYNLALALARLAEDSGARIHTGFPVDMIIPDPARRKHVSGIMLDGSLFESDVVISNSDATDTYLNLLPDNAISARHRRKISRIEPSCSGFVVLLGIDKTYDQLEHHNIFFSEDYENEFRAIFERRELPEEPTIYVTNTSGTDSKDAPSGCSNLYMLVNAPYTQNGQQWYEWTETYADHLIHTLENRGLDGLGSSVIERKVITPADFERMYRSNRGSIYGTSSNTRTAAFARPRNKSPWFDNLYLCGGSTHPGGGIPLVLQSALNVSTLLQRYDKRV